MHVLCLATKKSIASIPKMPLICAVKGCRNRSNRDNVRFFRLPEHRTFKHQAYLNDLSVERRKKWLGAIKRPELSGKPANYVRVCSKHFIGGKPAALTDNNNPDWIPSRFMGYQNKVKSSTQVESTSSECSETIVIVIQNDTPEAEKIEVELTPFTEEMEDPAYEPAKSDKSVQTELTMEQLSDIFTKCNIADNCLMSKSQTTGMSCKVLEGDDVKTLYYTGLPTFAVFTLICQCATPYLVCSKSLPPQDQCLLTLMKLRLNVDFKDLAYRFQISQATTARTFKNVIHVMYVRFKNVVFWPNREVLFKTMPTCFKETFHDKTTVIIDCFEIKIERPSKLVTAAQAWSNYKHNETIKYLIGITPQGTICYISEGWGDRVSDKFLTENSTFCTNTIPGDIIMADRGFLIKEFVEVFGASVKVPAFTRGKTQIHPTDLEATRAIVQCRIHVERVISAIRQKFKITNGVLSITLLATGDSEPLLDEIMFVCCALLNFCPPIVPL